MIGSFPIADQPIAVGDALSTVNETFVATVQRPDAPGQYLIEVAAYKGGEAQAAGAGAWAEVPLVSLPPGQVGVDIGLVDLVYADRHWTGTPTDADKPNIYYEGRAEIPVIIERLLPIEPEESRRVRRQFGEIRLSNNDGQLDGFVNSYAIDGRRVRVLFGPYGGDYDDFSCIADVLGVAWEARRESVSISVRDQSFSLDQSVQQNLYGGTGGADGTEEIEGTPKPLCFGSVQNIAPTPIDPVNLIYQINDGSIEGVSAVYDRGAALGVSGIDVSGYTALAASSPGAGNFATALDVGMFKLGSSPDGLITCDALGDNEEGNADTLDVIVLRILQDRHGLASRWIREDTIAGVAAIAGPIGYYISHQRPITTAQALDELIGSVGGWWGSSRDGRIMAGRLVSPDTRMPKLYLDPITIMDLEQEGSLIPRWRQRVGYSRNWTVQRGEDLAGVVTDERRQFLAEETRVVQTADAVVRVRHIEAKDPPALLSFYRDADDAQTLSDLLADLFSPDRRLIKVTVKRLGYLLDLGSVANVTWPRFGLENGKRFIVVGIREDADRDETLLRLWG